MTREMKLPTLVLKALTDSGYDLLSTAEDGWFLAGISGAPVRLAVRVSGQGVLLAGPELNAMARIGLIPVAQQLPHGMASAGLATDAALLYEALRVLHSVQAHPASVLSAKVETRLAAIPATERTSEVRQRIGQDVFREALLELWEGRCALSGSELPVSLLRASHAKPWSLADDSERLDPFNGLLLAVHYDALFDQGLITFDDEGGLLISHLLSSETRKVMHLDGVTRLRFVLPGHRGYLSFHRLRVANLQ
ncbi:HNH endonuclease [Xanthomonas codiaei]|uniref:HNH endonuclease n=2 Tax=Xanthomonas TaxID=338 RepID=UPI001E47AA13|nr:HNH endonuclease [Xanthomonas codiaei]MCC8536622.1 HNH endonuclease [Xanthomonas codiaei]